MMAITGKAIPQPGDIVRVRTRTYLVESVESAIGGHCIQGVCLDDDAQGQPLEAIWELELDTNILDESIWESIGKNGFDSPRHFSAYVHALRWNCVTATNSRLFQAPFRAGIRIDAYQLEPLRKALLLPRVNLFIADDVGLGKTIEAGLIASELLLRRRIREIVVACPPSMLLQWKEELDSRFGLTFEILDRAYIERVRQERGFGVNPWTTFPRFLVSQRLLVDESYAAPLRDWLDNFRPGSLLILDEAHHAAPASGAKYAIDSRITRSVRDLAPRFEHRLFLSATPHNGHSNSFSALLEILDSQRFTRGVRVLKTHLDQIMVRRLKEDVREIAGGFPRRNVIQIDIDSLPENAPELELARLLDEYRNVRQRRVAGATKRKQAEAALLISGLQQRLLSSIEAFAKTLRVHRRTMERLWDKEDRYFPSDHNKPFSAKQIDLLRGNVDADDDRSQLSEEDLGELVDLQVENSTENTAGESALADISQEKAILATMQEIAENARGTADARVRYLIEWIREHMCPGVRMPGESAALDDVEWTDTRILVFTEYEDTRRYLVNCLRAAIRGTMRHEVRIEVFHGPTPPDKRELIKRAFNAPPSENPVRILVATDAAREGLNLQAHCHNLFHFDVPWNPSRLEQRNGRIDRKLQPEPEVNCHYFVYTQRPEDRVLQALVRKTNTIREELGSLSQVLEARLAETLKNGIQRGSAEHMARQIADVNLDEDQRRTTEEEFEVVRDRQEKLRSQVEQLERRVEDARKWIGLDHASLRDAISCSLEMLGVDPLVEAAKLNGGPQRFQFPDLLNKLGGDPTWTTTLDTLRRPPDGSENGFEWRKNADIRPVVFEAPTGVDDSVVQLHLHHRVVQRLLSRFLSQGFVHHDLSRACLVQSSDSIPRVVLLGRLSLYGPGATRLHEEIVTVTARWSEPGQRNGPLTPYARDAEARTIDLLEEAMRPEGQHGVGDETQKKLLDSLAQDVQELLPHLQERAHDARHDAEAVLGKRGETEAREMRKILEDQRQRVLRELGRQVQMELFEEGERKQYESNRRYWERWIHNVEDDLETEPDRILKFYRVSSYRVEPVGIAYLLPAEGQA